MGVHRAESEEEMHGSRFPPPARIHTRGSESRPCLFNCVLRLAIDTIIIAIIAITTAALHRGGHVGQGSKSPGAFFFADYPSDAVLVTAWTNRVASPRGQSVR